MGFNCMSDKRTSYEVNLTQEGSRLYDESFMMEENGIEKGRYATNPVVDRSYYHQKSKNLYIEESDFLQYSQTGDLLLYSTRNLGGKLLRTATGSKYDHVSMIVKSWYPHCPEQKVFIFESVYDSGVRITDWECLRNDIGPDEYYS